MSRPKRYFVTIFMNDKADSFETTDLAKSFMDFKPEVVKGKVLVRVELGEKIKEKQLFVMRARRVFSNPLAATIFARDMQRSLI